MKKTLFSLVCAAAMFPAVGLYALTQPGLSEKWVTGNNTDFIGNWSSVTPDWSNRAEVKAGSNPRFATAADGKMYTVNQKTMYISEITNTGLVDVYELPAVGDDFYGTAISIDEAGNFLVGMNFVQAPYSSLYWTVYSPVTKAAKMIKLDIPSGWNIGRIDCVGRVLGDLTREAIFYIAPQSGQTPKVRVVKSTGTGTVESVAFETLAGVTVPQGASTVQQNIAQPAFKTYDEYLAAGADNYNFYYSASNGSTHVYAAYINGTVVNDFAPDMSYTVKSSINGFTTFELGDKRYFVRGYSPDTAGGFYMGIVVMDANGDALTYWFNENYEPNGGYQSLIAEPNADGTANIYVYNSGNKYGAAAMLTFDPSKCGAPVKPQIPIGMTAEDPYRVSTAADITNMAANISSSNFYVSLENDIDMAGVTFAPIRTGATIYFEGNNHVISNLTATTTSSGNWGLFDTFKGEVANLGLANVTFACNWGCAGALCGTSNGATITNCFSSGSVTGAAVGGFIGALHGTCTITDSYSLVNVSEINNHFAGGLVGRVGDASGNGYKLTVTNSYAGGTVSSAAGTAAGIASANQAASEVILDNAVAWNSSVSGAAGKVDAFVAGAAQSTVLQAFAYDGMVVNNVPVTEGATQDEIMAALTASDAYNKTVNNGRAVLAWQSANGNRYFPGTAENPFAITSPADLLAMRSYIVPGHSYFSLENDIDMKGVAYTSPLGDNNFTGRIVHFDGKCHVIKNFTCTSGAYPSLIGVFMGEIKNLGMEDVNISGGAAGVFGAFIGHRSYDGVTTVDNCYATGKVTGTSYAGGIGGYNNGNAVITNCYSDMEVVGGSYAGGIYSWVAGGETVIKNCYAAGFTEATRDGGKAGGIIVLEGGAATISDVVAWQGDIYGSIVAPVNAGSVDATLDNVKHYNEMYLNGDDVTGGVDDDELVATVTSWTAFSTKLNDSDKPMLKWQAGESTGINDIVADDTVSDGPAEYYNLQGVRVVNPDGGIYIVRQGSKVTKRYITK